ncbi:YjeF N-terminal domain-like protein [Rhodocollybia butyracea]|uniref:NAD(P)H-hydrate epimerase n=1 Tax=Rhodocollybia butyracea TaxID=206335 RepID=A0A9P5PMX9_9AGAR|nr:YjeF N-terminal domain-like protein [Rhodocollybia butyracea]
MSLRYLTAKLAQQIDDELINEAGAFSIDQLMELAGLAIAQALARVYNKDEYPNVLVCCGPGNQGGDGLVAARHLAMFGYNPVIFMPKGFKDVYNFERLKTQCDNMNIKMIPPSDDTSLLQDSLSSAEVILDTISGLSPKLIQAPFNSALPLLANSGLHIVSVDVPFGWDVEEGNVEGVGLEPDVLVSLIAPKRGMRSFRGRHFVAGRFIPKSLEEKFELNLPEYPDSDQIVELAMEEEAHR